MKDNIIIIGGSGLVGKAIINLEEIKSKFKIFVLDRHCDVDKHFVDFIECDINKSKFYKDIFKLLPKKSFIINLAARQYGDNPPKKDRLNWFLETNYYGCKNVLKLASTLDAKGFIQFSTDMVYGIPSSGLISENHPIKPIGEYGVSKAKIENYIINNRDNYKFTISIMRPRMILGKGRLGVLIKLFKLIQKNLPVPLIGSGRNFYQMVSDRDCARAVYYCIKAKCPPKAFNLGSEVKENVENLIKNLIYDSNSRSVLIKTSAKLTKTLIKILNLFSIEILFKEQYELADKNFILDITRSNKVLNWYPKDNDTSMMKVAYKAWMKDNIVIKIPKNLKTFVLSCGFIGFFPIASGTFCSFIFAFLGYIINVTYSWKLTFTLSMLTLILGTYFCFKLNKNVSKKDPGWVVIDEAAGQLIVSSFAGLNPLMHFIGFIFFRFFDITKIGLIKKSEKIRFGVGIMADDFLAAWITVLILVCSSFFLKF